MLHILIIMLMVTLAITNLIFVWFLVEQSRDLQSLTSKIGMYVLIFIWFLMTNYVIFMPVWGGLLKKG